MHSVLHHHDCSTLHPIAVSARKVKRPICWRGTGHWFVDSPLIACLIAYTWNGLFALKPCEWTLTEFDRKNVFPLRAGLVITVVIILAIFFVSTVTGRMLVYCLMIVFIVIVLCVVAIYWIEHNKRLLHRNHISSPMTKEECYNVYGIRFNPLSQVSVY